MNSMMKFRRYCKCIKINQIDKDSLITATQVICLALSLGYYIGHLDPYSALICITMLCIGILTNFAIAGSPFFRYCPTWSSDGFKDYKSLFLSILLAYVLSLAIVLIANIFQDSNTHWYGRFFALGFLGCFILQELSQRDDN